MTFCIFYSRIRITSRVRHCLPRTETKMCTFFVMMQSCMKWCTNNGCVPIRKTPNSWR